MKINIMTVCKLFINNIEQAARKNNVFYASRFFKKTDNNFISNPPLWQKINLFNQFEVALCLR